MLYQPDTIWSLRLLSLPPSLSLHHLQTWPPSLHYRVTPWLSAKWGKAAGEFRRMGSLQRRGSTFPKAQQVRRSWCIQGHAGKVCAVWTRIRILMCLLQKQRKASQWISQMQLKERRRKGRERPTAPRALLMVINWILVRHIIQFKCQFDSGDKSKHSLNVSCFLQIFTN